MNKAIICALLVAASHASLAAKSPHERLSGTWTSDLMTVDIDFAAHDYKGVAMGQTFDHRLTLVRENPQYVVFKTDGNTIVAQFQKGGKIMLTKQPDGIPVLLERASDNQ
ncbi:hypothetical protein [Salinisphaera orenii]|uniref:hypothetical protein n=1 Tax=Salinisphaera orenii TaxID=856731 RepID=UPI000DBE7F31